MSRINKDAADQLVASICREKLWASPEETEEWLKTKTGQHIATLIAEERKRVGLPTQTQRALGTAAKKKAAPAKAGAVETQNMTKWELLDYLLNTNLSNEETITITYYTARTAP